MKKKCLRKCQHFKEGLIFTKRFWCLKCMFLLGLSWKRSNQHPSVGGLGVIICYFYRTEKKNAVREGLGTLTSWNIFRHPCDNRRGRRWWWRSAECAEQHGVEIVTNTDPTRGILFPAVFWVRTICRTAAALCKEDKWATSTSVTRQTQHRGCRSVRFAAQQPFKGRIMLEFQWSHCLHDTAGGFQRAGRNHHQQLFLWTPAASYLQAVRPRKPDFCEERGSNHAGKADSCCCSAQQLWNHL